MKATKDMRGHVAQAAKELGILTADLAPLRMYEYEWVLKSILERFTTLGVRGRDHSWLWESFKEPHHSIPTEDALPLLPRLIPSDERVWLVAEDWFGTKEHDNFWLFEGKASAAFAVLGELGSGAGGVM